MKTFTSLISLVTAHDTAVRKLSRLEEIRGEILSTSREDITDIAPELFARAGPITGLGVDITIKFTAEDIDLYLKVLDLLIQITTLQVNELCKQLKECQSELLDK